VKREEWDRQYAGRALRWSAQPTRVLVAETRALPPGQALDVGCGEGRNAIWLAEQGWRVTGVDFSEVAIAKARDWAANRHVEVDFVCADLLEYEPQKGGYDLVFVFFLQLPADERRIVLSRAAASVAPDGTFLLLGHDLANLTNGSGGPSDPAVLYTPAEIVDELPGLEIEKAERVLRDIAGEDRPAIDALVRARRGALPSARG
jgi:SAM-dependent methyltransferase